MTAQPLPSALAAWFIHSATIPIADLARLLPMDEKTIRKHIEAGRLHCRFKGAGEKKRRRVFTESDVAGLLEAIGEETPCQYSASKARASTNSSFSSKVLYFPVRPNAPMQVRRRTTRTTGASKRKRSSTSSSERSADR